MAALDISVRRIFDILCFFVSKPLKSQTSRYKSQVLKVTLQGAMADRLSSRRLLKSLNYSFHFSKKTVFALLKA